MKVLVVENDSISRELARRVLAAGGYEVVEATDGEEALLLAPEAEPDLVLMDVGLPGIDGIETAQILHSERRTAAVPVLVWSALVFSREEERAREAGCLGYLTKPLGARELLEKVDAALGVERARI